MSVSHLMGLAIDLPGANALSSDLDTSNEIQGCLSEIKLESNNMIHSPCRHSVWGFLWGRVGAGYSMRRGDCPSGVTGNTSARHSPHWNTKHAYESHFEMGCSIIFIRCANNVHNKTYIGTLKIAGTTHRISLFCTSSQYSRRWSSEYIRNRIRSVQARLWVSCLSKFGLALPLNPESKTREVIHKTWEVITKNVSNVLSHDTGDLPKAILMA